jgi:hypothetical protein
MSDKLAHSWHTSRLNLNCLIKLVVELAGKYKMTYENIFF